MTKPLRAGVALSALAVAAVLTGCASMGNRSASAGGAFGGKVEDSFIALAIRAQQALAAKDYAGAITTAERLVAKSPTDAGFRTLLGNAYLGAGRFASAEMAFRDTLSLLPTQSGVPLKLVLAQIGQGRSDAALASLEQFRGTIDIADAGLATALAGQPGGAVAMLDEAARQEGADARVRQNLALAHALAGDWTAARTVASQDLPADQVDARMAEWMSFAKPVKASDQVASLIGITAVPSDPGQPERLALRSDGVRVAAAEPVAQPVMEPASSAGLTEPVVAEAPPAHTPAEDGDRYVEVNRDSPVMAAVEQPIPMPVDAPVALQEIRREPVRASGALPKPQQLRRAAAARFAAGNSKAVVQLGAYGSPARVAAAWSAATKRHAALKQFTPASARFNGPRGTVYRLSLKGFANDRQARLLCESLKRSGANCFVRSSAGDAPVRLASR